MNLEGDNERTSADRFLVLSKEGHNVKGLDGNAKGTRVGVDARESNIRLDKNVVGKAEMNESGNVEIEVGSEEECNEGKLEVEAPSLLFGFLDPFFFFTTFKIQNYLNIN